MLPDIVYPCPILENETSHNDTLILPSWTCNNYYVNYDFTKYHNLQHLEIGEHCFGFVKIFNVANLNKLKSVKIGSNSFTGSLNSYGNDESKSFHILNCESLESIEIGEYSFSDYAGEFELKNLSKLESLIIGSNTSNSYNFYNTNSLIFEGILIIDY